MADGENSRERERLREKPSNTNTYKKDPFTGRF